MLISLILRGVSFEFRVKASGWHQSMWNHLFFAGSLGTSVAQGAMLAGVHYRLQERSAVHRLRMAGRRRARRGLCVARINLLVIKTEGDLHRRALRWAYGAVVLAAIGVAAISLATPFANAGILEKWFRMAAPAIAVAIAAAYSGCFWRHSVVGEETATGKIETRMGAFRLGGMDIRVCVCRTCLQPVPLSGGGENDPLAGGRRQGIPDVRFCRDLHRAAVDYRLHGVFIQSVLGEGALTQLR